MNELYLKMNMRNMTTKILMIFCLAAVLMSCSKNKYTTKPQLFLKSVSSTVVAKGQPLTFNIEFTDKEGDVQDSMWIQKVSKVCPNSPLANWSQNFQVPNFPATKDLKGNFEINFINNVLSSGYYYITGCGNAPDTCYFRFVLTDLAGHSSDTLVSPNIVLLP
ncbi:hypothetical protein [Hydrotalea sandarakina]|jgi:hypothetical protein|uniref:Uncharacterized protein n=1 Tax=Hydrotalea sandarakina TaxID=1004304 RepID=A0A2W7RNA7_9BACT|nr:hypothetical protein [Hydrotalea sandarakina]PZX61864.1 hypothetical protein LX80_02026 [Hydrotalea sandarakina]